MLKERVEMVEGHAECNSKHYDQCDGEDHRPNECLEYALKHDNIETSVCMERRNINCFNY